MRTDLGTSNQTDYGSTGQREMGPRRARKAVKDTKGMEGEGDIPHAVKSGEPPGSDSAAMEYDASGSMTCRVEVGFVLWGLLAPTPPAGDAGLPGPLPSVEQGFDR